MVKLSFNIPTFNRATFLLKNLSIIVTQIRFNQLINDVEINISDNFSSDNTEEVIKKFKSQNSDIIINYSRNDSNQGPDINFIKAMNMASGDYSILFGDDDYLVADGLERIFNVIYSSNNCGIILSNRINIDVYGNVIGEESFLREDIDSRCFDFSNNDQLRSYFSVCSEYSLGGCLSFISSVIYKTSIISLIGEYNSSFTGTCYSFMYYWWNFLMKGNSLMYVKDFFVLCTTSGATNNNYGSGIRRMVIDVEGISKVAELVFQGDIEQYKQDFLTAANKCNSYASLFTGFVRHRDFGISRLLPSLSRFGWSERKIKEFTEVTSFDYCLKALLGFIVRKK